MNRRDRILEAAASLVAHYGPNKTTVADIAREAGIGVGSVYLDFPTKATILAALAQRHHETLLAAMERAIDDASDDSGELLARALNARTKQLLRLRRRGRHSCELVHRGCDSVEVAWSHYVNAERALVARILTRGAREGTLAVEPVEETVEVVMLALAGLSPPAVFDLDEELVERRLAQLTRILLDGLRCREADSSK